MDQKTQYPYADVGARLKLIRLSTGLKTITEFVDLMQINYTRYINWETGCRRIVPEEAVDFCDKFDVTLDFIYRGKLSALPINILKLASSKPLDSAQSTSSDMSEREATSIR